MMLSPNKQKTNKHLFHIEMNFYIWCNHNWINDKITMLLAFNYTRLNWLDFFVSEIITNVLLIFSPLKTLWVLFSFFNITLYREIGFALIIFRFLLIFLLLFTRGVGGFRSGTTGQAWHKTRRHIKFSTIWNRKNKKWDRTAMGTWISPNHSHYFSILICDAFILLTGMEMVSEEVSFITKKSS